MESLNDILRNLKSCQTRSLPYRSDLHTSTQGCIEHRNDYLSLAFREEYITVCKASKYKKTVKDGEKNKASVYCKAFILAVFEMWTDDKTENEEDVSIYMD